MTASLQGGSTLQHLVLYNVINDKPCWLFFLNFEKLLVFYSLALVNICNVLFSSHSVHCLCNG